ncbi:P-loop containing nucleoside triphosphate hydrolase protein [Yamadazyma tenuis ATCC 10573]|uniref:p-loop containing nucleoside triphosphate hydrolase protein n=1 Tax=Candida tenuis (strain ATCC 10573 / BCRC 21748 / CBS 615 / JCM 9827 / NBRC 10315 / NRRL Y-1498 / VKM Y-70) TaxID=590646 RepID=G3BB93_CANTC|nr:P-loop containing nucleoside triphosphate hydrolase protein [Yamadazyma tenuis ATCC 10573]EGV61521.1 P-loop containing nucleoside triphosphate hydrolase protein [Yamadazyma tenuis ATCC 10573]
MVPYPPGPEPFYRYVSDIVSNWQLSPTKSPIIIGVSGPQGSGKSFAVDQAVAFLYAQFPHVKVAQMSMDDVYLTHAQQQLLTQKSIEQMDNNRLVQGRGLPGTHDLELLGDVLHKIRIRDEVAIPRYDKSAFNGEGDRAPRETWTVYTKQQAVDVLLFEGWFNGYLAIPDEEMSKRYNALPADSASKTNTLQHMLQVNDFLKKYGSVWYRFDYFINFETEDINNVYKWRLQQEHDLIAKRGSGMTDAQVASFISRYMAMYEVYYEDLCRSGSLVEDTDSFNIKINLERRVLV